MKFSASAALRIDVFEPLIELMLELMYICLIANIMSSLSSSWISAVCAANIVHRNHFFRLYQQNKFSESKIKFKQASNRCQMIRETAKLADDDRTKRSETKGSRFESGC